MNSVTLPPAIDTRTEDEIERDWEVEFQQNNETKRINLAIVDLDKLSRN